MAKQAKKKAERKHATTIPAAILKALSRRKNGATTDELAKLTGRKGSSVSSACSKMVHRKQLKRTDPKNGRGTEAVWKAI